MDSFVKLLALPTMTSSLSSVSCLRRLVCVKSHKNEEGITNYFFCIKKKLGQDPIIGGPKPVTAVETQVMPNDANHKDVSQDGEVSLELTNKKGEKYAVDGIAKKIVPPSSFVQEFFVTSRGGEYYFVPSIDTVKSWGAKAQINKK